MRDVSDAVSLLSLLGIFVIMMVWAVRSDIAAGQKADRRVRRSTPPSPGSIPCAAGVHGGWGSIRRVWQRPPRVDGGPAWFTGDLDCLATRAHIEFDVVTGSAWPLNDCPERASRESLIETQIAIDRLCDAAKIEEPLAALNIVRLPSGAPLMVRGSDILRSVIVGPDGRLSIIHDFAIEHPTGRSWDNEPPFAHDLYVVWTERSPDGSLLFTFVDHALRASTAPVPTRWTSRVAHGDARPVPGIPAARLELRSLGRDSLRHISPWEVALIRGPFLDTDKAESGSAISMVTHQPPTPIVADNTAKGRPDRCMICSKMVAGKRVARLRRCGHTMHGPCHQASLAQQGMQRGCPICLMQVPSRPTGRHLPLPWWEEDQ